MQFAKSHASAVAALTGAALVAAYLVCSGTPVAEGVLYMAASLGGLTALLVGLRWRLSRAVRAWQMFSLAVALFAGGDLLWALDEVAGLRAPWPHLSDVLYLGSYPLFAGALIGFSASRREAMETVTRQIADAGLLFTAAFSGVWFLVLDPIVDRQGLAGVDLALTVAYPMLDLVLLSLTLRYVFTSGPWPLAYRLVATAFFLMFVGDIAWRVSLASGSYGVSSAINTLFMGGYVLWAVAALHPSVKEIGRFGFVAPALRHRMAWRRLAVVGIASCVPPVVLVLGRRRIDDRTDIVIFAVALLALPLLTLIRVGDMLQSLHRVLAERDQIIDSSPVPIAVVDRDGIVHVWNPAAEEVSGFAAADVIGSAAPIVPAEDHQRVALLYSEALRGVAHEHVDVKVLNSEGHPIDVRVSNAPLGTDDGRIVALFEDVTREREQEEAIAYLASHDPLTGLPNRRSFEEELAAVTTTHAGARPKHVALFDIDEFKSLNDTGGHTLGDEILRALATLLGRTVRHDGSLARLSGDEFALILFDVDDEGAMTVVERVLDTARDFRLDADGITYDVTLSAGLYSLAVGDAPQLALRRADEALYRAKANGKNRAEAWGTSPLPWIGAARAWSPRIKDALRDDRVDLYLQPIVTLADETVTFHEALCRLRAEDGTIVPAKDWIEHAEQIGFMPSIDLRMIEKAEEILCSDRGLRVFVNISPSSFLDPRVLGRLDAALARVPRGSLGIEITEHTALADLGRAVETLSRFRAHGALVAIDDFGLGFTSFAELATLPCDIVKIPGSFTEGAQPNLDTEVIAAAITNIAHHYGKQVVIEGVEYAAGARRARQFGIEYAQGWHYGRPVPSVELDSTELAASA